MKKIDIFLALISGLGLAFLFSGILKDYHFPFPFLIPILFLIFPLLSILGLQICFLLGKRFLIFFQAGKFILAGILATLMDWGVFKFLRLVFPFEIAILKNSLKGTSFLVATFGKYWLNKFWTFEKTEKKGVGREISQFYAITLFGLLLNVLIFSLLVNTLGPKWGILPKTWETMAVIFSAVLVAVWNFFGYKFLVFKK